MLLSRLVEFDAPAALMAQHPDGVFAQLVTQSRRSAGGAAA